MGRPPARVDILMSLAGLRFADAWPNRMATHIDGVPGYVIARKDLIANKRARGRPHDMIDVNNLEESERLAEKPAQAPEAPKKRPPGRPRKGKRGKP